MPPPPPHSNWFPRPSSRKDRSRASTDRAYTHNLDDFGSTSTAYGSVHSHFEKFSSTLPARHRSNILSAATGALGLRKKIGSVSRKKPNFPSLPHANVMPGVIEISARNNTIVTSSTAHRDCEHEERERLRDAAAQSIGLGPELLLDSHRSESHLSLDSHQTPRASMPPFPATLAALRPFTQLSATVPKFSPPSSLLVYALAKQWKPRTIVLTSHPPTHETHVHLFKSTSKNDKEIERLQVTEDTVIFVAEEDVGGRGNVVKFAARDISSKRSAATGQDGLRTMWYYLQIADTAESQRWIATIKAAVLAQRAVRAGLDISAQSNGRNEPKGDMDVMLSMHLQGLITMNPARPSPTLSQPMPTSPSPTASLRSLGMSVPSSPSPTTTVKGIFSASRPGSPSIEGPTTVHGEGSFGVVGTSLLTMLRNKSSADSTSSPARSLPLSPSSGSGRGSPAPSLRSANMPVITASDLKISRERDTLDVVPGVRPSTASPIPSLTTQGALTFSLQPPPRKGKNVAATPPPLLLPEQKVMYKQADGNRSVAGNFGIPSRGSGDETPGKTSPVSPESLRFSAEQSDSFLPRVASVALSSSIDEAHGSEESDEVTTPLGNGNGIANLLSPAVGSALTDKLSQSVAITKRWSRQGVALPKQPTPPSKPPPSIPLSSENSNRTSVESSTSIPVVRSLDRSPSTSSFNSLSRPRTSPQSNSSLSPTFWKRASLSSTYSVGSVSTSDSRVRPLVPISASGESFSLSYRPVADNVSSSRPMSLYVSGPPPVAHIATTKRRSMPPPRPAPNFAPPPAPIVQEYAVQAGPSKIPAFVPPKSFRSSVAQRAMRLSMSSPKPPPSTALPPRPDDPAITRGHRRGSSAGAPDLHPIPALSSSRPHSSSLSDPDPTPSRTLSIRQRLRNLSTPPVSHSPAQSPTSSVLPSFQVSTLDLSDDNEDDLSTPYFVSPQPFGLGEHITTMQNEPSFLQLSNAAASLTMLPPLSSSAGPMSSSGLGTSPLVEADCEFVALSPPPPRRGSKPFAVAATRTEKIDGEEFGLSDTPQEEGTLLAFTQSGSVVSLGFVTT